MKMQLDKPQVPYLVRPLPLLFILGLVLVNAVAIFQFDPLYIGAFFSFLYIIIVPGFLLLPFLTERKLPPLLGITFSAALSVLMLMLTGLAINSTLPFFGINAPLSPAPLLVAFNLLIYLLLIFNYEFGKESPFELHSVDGVNWTLIGLATAIPLLSCLGAIRLNNGGSNIFSMLALGLVLLVFAAMISEREKVGSSTPPLVLYFMALAFLLMNSMRGWLVSGHDVLLEYHVFTLVSTAHAWSMALYHDPYMACLSITILPVYLQNLLHIDGAYIFKFFMQWLGALPVVMVYYLSKKYISPVGAFLAGFLYISFPTFMTDMAFLNRQSIAFLFFAAMIFILLTPEYFRWRIRNLSLFLFAAGMVFSHYATSYVAMALLAIAYVLNKVLRAFRKSDERALLTLPFVIVLIASVMLWSVFITNTADNLFNTAGQVIVNLEHPLNLGVSSGIAQYSILQSNATTPQERFTNFLTNSTEEARAVVEPSNLYPLDMAGSYPTALIPEPLIPLTSFGKDVQSILHLSLTAFFSGMKQAYAKIMQILLLLGILGFIFGYQFKENLLSIIPTEYTSFAIAGIVILVGQTLLPTSAVDYGLLRLFQQNLIFLALPIMLVLLAIVNKLVKENGRRVVVCSVILLFFFAVLSGFLPQFTGGARPPLMLNNYGFYYDSYYTHADEVSSINWLAANANGNLPVQADHYFSGTKILAYSGIAPQPVVFLPETIQKNSYVYLGQTNVEDGNAIDYANGDIVYYRFPLNFLENNKNLIYNNGGSKIYH